MQDKLRSIEQRYISLEAQLSAGETYSDPALFTRLNREMRELEPVVKCIRRCAGYREQMESAKELLSDPEFSDLAREELDLARDGLAAAEEELKILLLPKDPNDDKNVIVEIRAGAGGEEAALFAHSLHRMYGMYAQTKGWQTETANMNITELGGVKEVSFIIEGEGAYSRLKFESGVHRVQRVPETESGGRIHTSTVTVAVLPELDEVEFTLNPDELQIDTFRSSGAGGQHVNKTESAIRITHLPTGTVVECQDERSQYKNKARAMSILAARLYQAEKDRQTSAQAAQRKAQVGTGMRNERIRTYNFPQGRVTDHRIGLTLHKIDQIMDGALDELIDALITDGRARQLQSGDENEN